MAIKIPLSFKESDKEKELYDWIKLKSEIIGQSNFIKQILYEKMLEDKAIEK